MKSAIPVHAVSRQQQVSATPVHLTPRQVEVLYLLCEGLPNKLICRQLNIATGTVKVHIGVILRELGVTSRLQAVVAAQRCGLLAAPAASTTVVADAAASRPVMVAGAVHPASSRVAA